MQLCSTDVLFSALRGYFKLSRFEDQRLDLAHQRCYVLVFRSEIQKIDELLSSNFCTFRSFHHFCSYLEPQNFGFLSFFADDFVVFADVPHLDHY